MQPLLGSFLRQLRQSRRLSQTQAARAAEIGRITLNRWEMGVQQPRLVDLEALLSALTATPEERQQALVMLNTPQARAQIRDTIVRVEDQRRIGPMPHGGDLLRALRLRRGLSQEETAKRVGVTVRALRRWEKHEVWPSPTQLHTLCYALEVATEEMVALTTGHFAPMSNAEAVTLEELKVQGHRLNFFAMSSREEALKELCYVTLEVQAWPLAARSGIGGQVLAALYSHHANHLFRHKRFAESGIYADRALELWPKETHPNQTMVQASIAMARAAVHRGARAVPQRGLEVLGHWLREARWPEYEAWLLSEMAAYVTQDGNVERGLQLARQAKEVAAHSRNRHELYNRELDEARLLISVGKPGEALSLIQRDRDKPFTDHPAKFALLEVEAYLVLEETSLAHDHLQKARQLIEADSLVHLQPQAQALAQRF